MASLGEVRILLIVCKQPASRLAACSPPVNREAPGSQGWRPISQQTSTQALLFHTLPSDRPSYPCNLRERISNLDTRQCASHKAPRDKGQPSTPGWSQCSSTLCSRDPQVTCDLSPTPVTRHKRTGAQLLSRL